VAIKIIHEQAIDAPEEKKGGKLRVRKSTL
jgi:hypothetical protein